VFPQKLAVGAQLAKVIGWERPTEVKLEAGENLASFLGRLFNAGGTLNDNGSGTLRKSGDGHGERNQQTDNDGFEKYHVELSRECISAITEPSAIPICLRLWERMAMRYGATGN
jgi:hypothetical protein